MNDIELRSETCAHQSPNTTQQQRASATSYGSIVRGGPQRRANSRTNPRAHDPIQDWVVLQAHLTDSFALVNSLIGNAKNNPNARATMKHSCAHQLVVSRALEEARPANETTIVTNGDSGPGGEIPD